MNQHLLITPLSNPVFYQTTDQAMHLEPESTKF